MRTFINIKPIDKIDKADLQRLIDDEIYENQNIDYKLKLEFTTEGKNDLLSTVSAMANTDGGIIAYGIVEKRDTTGQPMGLPETVEGFEIDNWDKTRLKIEQLINDCIQPRIQNIESKHFVVNDNKIVIIIKVPASILAPHMTFMDKCTRFYKRNTGGNQIMDYIEIRNSFKQSVDIIERLDNFRRKRVDIVHFTAKEQPIELGQRPKIFVHYMPLFTEDYILDFSNDEVRKLTMVLPLLTDRGRDYRLNYDGRLCFDEDSYVQMFRNGNIEFCDTTRLTPRQSPHDATNKFKSINLDFIENDIIKTTKEVINLYGRIGITLPIAIFITIVKIRGYSPDYIGNHGNGNIIDKADLFFPKAIIEASDSNIETALKPLFDMLWNAAGFSGSRNYYDDGSRVE